MGKKDTLRAPMALTAELVARIARTEPDPGPRPDLGYHSEQDYDDVVTALLAEHNPDDLWIFAYGSLIWKPEFDHVEHCRATATGWHRSFCMKITRWRGTPAQPGLMMGLDRGGSCQGVAYRLPAEDRFGQLGRLVRREMSVKPATNTPRWIKTQTSEGKLRALAMTVNPKGSAYIGRLPPEEVARMLAVAVGHLGSGAEYLFQTVKHLDEYGIRDAYLWRLQELVAREIHNL